MTAGTAGLRVAARIWRGDRELLSVAFHVGPGDSVTVMGPSGSGKSTLLSYIAGFLDPAFSAEGKIVIDGQEVTGLSPQARRFGLLFQDDLLFPHLSVGGNLLFGLPSSISGRARRMARVTAALEEIGLAGYAGRDPSTLSGGERARVALARTLLSAPRALLLDEPFSRLDLPLRDQIRRLVFEAARRHRLPVVLVTHDPADAAAAGGKIVHIG